MKVPLTSAANSSAALYIESEAGKEDWHPVDCSYGEITKFYGSSLHNFFVFDLYIVATDYDKFCASGRLLPISACLLRIIPVFHRISPFW